jgi:hypothetical protein
MSDVSIPPMSTDAAPSRQPGTPAVPPAYVPDASPASNGASTEPKKRNSAPGEFPIRLGLNITPAMHASLQRMRRRMRLKEAVIGRLGLMQYLAANDPQYRE